MKKVNNCWVDENNNRWNCLFYTEEEAEKCSKTLNNCKNCKSCMNCMNCMNCSYCSYCSNCSVCVDCSDCSYCSDCINCSDCSRCSDCINCSDCSRCSDCGDCSDCSRCNCCNCCSRCVRCNHCGYCNDFEDNPQSYTTPKIGSRYKSTTIYWLGDNVQVVCGCFRGNLEQWEEAINATHKDNEKHREDYLKQVRVVRNLIKESK